MNDPSTIGRGDRIAVTGIMVVGMLMGGFAAGTGLLTGIFRLISPSDTPIELVARIPLDTGPGVIEAHGTQLLVRTDQLTGTPLWLFALSDVIGGLTIAVITASAALLLWRIAQRRPFHHTMRTAALVAGCALSFGSLLSQGLAGIGQLAMSIDLGESLGRTTEPGFLFTPLPVIAGFVILALAYVFQAGTRLQQDQEGLI